jgi:hypothetical protein
MKKSFLLSISALLAFTVGCDNAANMEAMKAKTMHTIDSLAAAEVAAQRATLLTQCNQSIDAAIQGRVDSLMAIAAPTKTLSGAGKTSTKPTKKPVAPTPAPAPKPTPPKKTDAQTKIDEQKARGGNGTGAKPTQAEIDVQKSRGTKTLETVTTKSGTTSTVAVPVTTEEAIKKQKARGGATPK